jgi:Mg/Co/Ni transporter MgtE
MTTELVVAAVTDTVGDVVARLSEWDDLPDELDAVALVDGEGRLVWDLPLMKLVVSPPGTRLGALAGESDPVSVDSHARVDEVAERLVEARRLSVVVVDDGRPVGRILADDVLDALSPERGRLHFPRLLQ